jgi:hypothetical protein
MLLNEHEILSNWSPIIESSTGITDKSKLKWMSNYAHIHDTYDQQNGAINESNSYSLTSTVNGMGATRFPANPGSQGGFYNQATGSGDKAPTLLPLALQVAAQTVGLDLVPVIPTATPLFMFSYMDFVYAGGKLDGIGSNIPQIIKVTGTQADFGDVNAPTPLAFKFIGTSRLDGKSIYQLLGTVPAGSSIQAQYDTLSSTTGNAVEFVKALEDHITGFSGASYTSNDPYSRQAGESTMDNVMNLSLFSKSGEVGTFQVAAAVTREQVQDLKQFGVDAVSQVEAVLINELTQSINKNILGRLFEMGDRNHDAIIKSQGVNFFLHIGATATTVGTQYGTKFQHVAGATVINPSENASSPSENQGTRQRKIMSKMLGMSNMISIRGRNGQATYAVTNGQVATALQDCAGFIAYPLMNTISQQAGALYPIGSLAGVMVYVDPNMSWSDTRLHVGRKGDGTRPGLVFMPYLIAESVQTIAEGTMSPKLAIKSRYALVEYGQHPETMYLTTGISMDGALGSLV